ncbi:hypothetical protein [Lysobacter gummosus]|uniref:hypothetical protein n=1 Tax=Lysobacter gummosus TaxID=262324 RepID=UPI003639E6FC
MRTPKAKGNPTVSSSTGSPDLPSSARAARCVTSRCVVLSVCSDRPRYQSYSRRVSSGTVAVRPSPGTCADRTSR